MNLHGYAWNEETGMSKVDVSVERTDADEVALFARSDDEEVVSLYVSVETAVRIGTMFGIAALAHELQAHEAAKIADRSAE